MTVAISPFSLFKCHRCHSQCDCHCRAAVPTSFGGLLIGPYSRRRPHLCSTPSLQAALSSLLARSVLASCLPHSHSHSSLFLSSACHCPCAFLTVISFGLFSLGGAGAERLWPSMPAAQPPPPPPPAAQLQPHRLRASLKEERLMQLVAELREELQQIKSVLNAQPAAPPPSLLSASRRSSVRGCPSLRWLLQEREDDRPAGVPSLAGAGAAAAGHSTARHSLLTALQAQYRQQSTRPDVVRSSPPSIPLSVRAALVGG